MCSLPISLVERGQTCLCNVLPSFPPPTNYTVSHHIYLKKKKKKKKKSLQEALIHGDVDRTCILRNIHTHPGKGIKHSDRQNVAH